METSVLNSIKKLLGIGDTFDGFDTEVIIHINSAIARLRTLGLNGEERRVTDQNTTWENIGVSLDESFDEIKTYIYLSVKMVFDPPQSSAAIEAFQKEISKKEFTIQMVIGGE